MKISIYIDLHPSFLPNQKKTNSTTIIQQGYSLQPRTIGSLFSSFFGTMKKTQQVVSFAWFETDKNYRINKIKLLRFLGGIGQWNIEEKISNSPFFLCNNVCYPCYTPVQTLLWFLFCQLYQIHGRGLNSHWHLSSLKTEIPSLNPPKWAISPTFNIYQKISQKQRILLDHNDILLLLFSPPLLFFPSGSVLWGCSRC